MPAGKLDVKVTNKAPTRPLFTLREIPYQAQHFLRWSDVILCDNCVLVVPESANTSKHATENYCLFSSSCVNWQSEAPG